MSIYDNEAQVLKNNDLHQHIDTVLTKLHTILVSSYGPLGKNTIIHKNGAMPTVTKDGLTILRSVRFDERVEYDIYQLIRSISNGLVDKVGDGSTSAVLSAVNIYRHLKDISDKYTTIKDFDNTIKAIQNLINKIFKVFLTKHLAHLADIEEQTKVLSLIAAISNNNDIDLGRSIAEIMVKLSPESIVSIKDNPLDNSELISHTFLSGFQTNSYRLAHPVYFNNSSSKAGIELNNGVITVMTYNFTSLHYNYLLQKVIPILPNKTPIVVICETPEASVVTQIVKDAMVAINTDKIPSIFLMETGGLSNKGSMDTFNDLEAYLGCNASAFNALESLDSPLPANTIGNAKRVLFFPNSTSTFDLGAGFSGDLPIYHSRLDGIEEELLNVPSGQKATRGALRKRINRLNGMNVTIYVGGRTQEEKESLRYLVDDSVLACKSVMKAGYTLGGNYTTFFAFSILVGLLGTENEEENRLSLQSAMNCFDKSNNNEENIEDSNEVQEILDGIKELLSDPLALTLVERLQLAYKNVVTIPQTHQDMTLIQPSIALEKDNSITYTIHNTFNNLPEVFNLNNTVNTTSVISPIQTDIEILNASLSIITLLLTSNQFIQ